jgi:hypothetical protein
MSAGFHLRLCQSFIYKNRNPRPGLLQAPAWPDRPGEIMASPQAGEVQPVLLMPYQLAKYNLAWSLLYQPGKIVPATVFKVIVLMLGVCADLMVSC